MLGGDGPDQPVGDTSYSCLLLSHCAAVGMATALSSSFLSASREGIQ